MAVLKSYSGEGAVGMVKRGKFITLEGGEGAGKSTQIRHILAHLNAVGITALATREPGGTPHAEALREVLLSGRAKNLGPAAEAMLFSAARIDHIENLIEPALRERKWVVCDRFSDSTRAYQGAMGNLDARFMQALEEVTLGALYPDLTIILDIDPRLGLARAAQRRGQGEAVDRFEGEALAFHKALREAFRDIAEREPQRCVLIDAAQGESKVASQIIKVIDERLFDARLRARAHALIHDKGPAQ